MGWEQGSQLREREDTVEWGKPKSLHPFPCRGSMDSESQLPLFTEPSRLLDPVNSLDSQLLFAYDGAVSASQEQQWEERCNAT